MSLQGWTLSNNIIFFLLLLVSTTFVYCDFQPREFHLAFTNNPNELVVSFHTSNYSEQLLGKPLITFSTSENLANYETASVGSVVTSYGDSSKTGFDFHVLLTNLKFATKYYYKCGFEKAEFLSETFFFYTRTDPKSDESKETTIVIYGDQGTTNSKYVIAQTQGFVSNFLQKSKNKNLFIYHLGDIGYADDFAGAMYQPIWTKYMQMMNRIMPYVPYMVCVGNHEVSLFGTINYSNLLIRMVLKISHMMNLKLVSKLTITDSSCQVETIPQSVTTCGTLSNKD